ncbi:hypothetical protein [uncultured Clostridium sp.]|uniref:hypothetical protein n=1 Tax=uncultured Clostridium sp. TaxID=59620 RepID=UPI00321656ED
MEKFFDFLLQFDGVVRVLEWVLFVIVILLGIFFIIVMFKNASHLQEAQKVAEKFIRKELKETVVAGAFVNILKINKKTVNLSSYLAIGENKLILAIMDNTLTFAENGTYESLLSDVSCQLKKSILKNHYIVILKIEKVMMKLRVHRKWPCTNLENQKENALNLLREFNRIAIKSGNSPIEVDW